MKNWKKRLVSVSVVLLSVLIICDIAYAAGANGYDYSVAMTEGGWTSTVTGIRYNSFGKINYSDGNNSVVIDAADIATIDELVGNGKKEIRDAIKSIDQDDRMETSQWDENYLPDFTRLAELIASSQAVEDPDNSNANVQQAINSEGDLLYFKTQAAAETKDLTKTGTMQTEYPVYYQAATANNMVAGAAAFVNGKLVLGTGADYDHYFDNLGDGCTTNVVASYSHTGDSNGKKTITFKESYDFLVVTCLVKENGILTNLTLTSDTGSIKNIENINESLDETSSNPSYVRVITAFLFNVSEGDKLNFNQKGGYRWDVKAYVRNISFS